MRAFSFFSHRRAGILLFALATLAAFVFAERRLSLENDLVASLASKDKEFGEVFARAQASGVFRGKIFVEPTSGTEALPAELSALLAKEGYSPTHITAGAGQPGTLLPLAVHLPAETLADSVSTQALDARENEILAGLMLPGGEALVDLAAGDPLGLLARVGERFAPRNLGTSRDAGVAAEAPLFVFESPRPLDFERVGRLQAALIESGARFIGEDFFAYENYATIRHDILVCSLIAVPLNLLLYFVFIRDRRFLLFTLAGNAVSYAWGLFLGTLFFPALYGVALAFTTTFLSFNNEYLVHLSGADARALRERKLGLLSAIGTTLLGFLALLFGSSALVKQLALLSLGGMAGFLGFLWVFRSQVEKIAFRTFHWPMVTLGPRALAAGTLACLVALAVTMPGVATRVREFRSFTPELESSIEHFTARAQGLSGGSPVALEVVVAEDVGVAISRAIAQGAISAGTPWSKMAPADEQRANAAFLAKEAPAAIEALRARLAAKGISLPARTDAYARVIPQDAASFCASVEFASPLPLCHTARSGRFFVFLVRTPELYGSDADARLSAALPPLPDGKERKHWGLQAERYYDAILTGFSRELGWLFAAGLAAMLCYLGFLHRSAGRLAYILFPVLLSGVVVFLWLRATGGTLNVIHMLAFSLVISLGLDYSSLALSSHYEASDMSRVLLTGLSTLAGFGVLAAARHPVLRDLGVVVCLGAGFSLAFAALFRYSPEVRST